MNLFSIPDAPAWFNALLNLSAQATILAGLVWITLKMVGRWIPPSWRALMWFVVILRLLIPFSPPSPFSLQNLFTVEAPVVETAAPVVQVVPQLPTVYLPTPAPLELASETISSYAAPLSPAQTKPIRYTRVFTWIWGGAASFLIALLGVRALVIRYRLVRDGSPPAPFLLELLRACCVRMRLRYPIRITASDRIAAPALTGLVPARLIIPSAFGTPRFAVSEIRQIFMHELSHLQQGHLILHWLALITRAIHWFNPAIHFAALRMRQECELAADAAALMDANVEERAAYGETMLKVLQNSIAPPTLLALGMAEQTRHLKERLKALKEPGQTRSYLLTAALLCALVICGFSSASPTRPTSTAPRNEAPIREMAMQAREETPANRSKALVSTNFTQRTTVEVARELIRSGDIEGAESLLQKAVNDGTLNSVINEKITTLTAVTNIVLARTNLIETNRAALSPNQKRLIEKLATIHIDDFPIASDVDLVEVLKELGSELRRRDPARRGINLIIVQPPAGPPNAPPPIDLERFQIKFDPPIRDVTLGQLFDTIVRVAKPPPGAPPTARLKYSVEDYGVYFALLPTNEPPPPSPVPSAAAARQKLSQKLDAIRLEEYPLPAPVDLIEVLKELSAEARRRDADRHGVNFIIDTMQPRGANAAIDLERFTIKIDPPVRNVSIRQLCELIVKLARPPEGAPANARLKYSIEDYGVVFSLDVEEKDPKHSSVRPAANDRFPAPATPNNVEFSWNSSLRRELLPQPNPFSTVATVAVAVHTSPERQALYRKLETMRIDDFPLAKETDLRDVLKELASEIRTHDVNFKGINFILNSTGPRAVIDPLTGLAPSTRPEVDVGDFKIKFNPPIRDVTLGQFLDAIVMVAKSPEPEPPPGTFGLRYSVEDYGIVFSLRPLEREQLVSRTFKINPNTFRQGLEGVYFSSNPFQGVVSSQPGSGTSGGNFQFNANQPVFVSTVTNFNSIQQEVRSFFSAAGVDFPTNNVAVGSAVPAGFGVGGPQQIQQKALFFNDRAGVLYVRATKRDLDLIENVIHAINMAPPALRIDVRIFEAVETAAFPKTPTPIPPAPMSITNIGFLTPDQANTFLLVAAARSSTVVTVTNFSIQTLNGRRVEIPLSRRNASAAAGTEQHDPTLELSVYGSGIDPSIFEVSPLVTTFEVVGDATNRFRVRQTALPQTKLNAGDTLVVAAPAMNSNKVPVVAEIPQLGRLFTKPEEEIPRRVWLILMTPAIEPRKN